jgi:undecaprenyl-diphosphatase
MADMSLVQASLLGLLQGITEFLPVSSTAHMDIVPQLFGQPDPGAAFSAIAQLGPIIAIIAYFRADLIRYVSGILRTKSPARVAPEDLDARLGWYTLLGTLPLAVFGLLLEKKIDTQFRSLYVVAVSLIALGLVLLLAERVGRRDISLEKMTFKQSQVIGWAQAIALVPGTSRSGVTITAGLFQGLDRESAARFSFLLSIPAITAAGLYKLFKEARAHHLAGVAGQGLVAAVVAGVFAYIVVTWFLKYMKEHNTGVFIIYRILLGLALLALLSTGRLHERRAEPEQPPAPTTSLALPPAARRMPIRSARATDAIKLWTREKIRETRRSPLRL